LYRYVILCHLLELYKTLKYFKKYNCINLNAILLKRQKMQSDYL
jgi:hypothetical protein